MSKHLRKNSSFFGSFLCLACIAFNVNDDDDHYAQFSIKVITDKEFAAWQFMDFSEILSCDVKLSAELIISHPLMPLHHLLLLFQIHEIFVPI